MVSGEWTPLLAAKSEIRGKGAMGIRNLACAAIVGAAAITVAPSSASSQVVTFSTSGTFGNGCAPFACSFGGYVLQWSGITQGSWAPPSDVVLGNFTMTCFSSSCSAANIIAGSTFMLTITQTGPNAGTGSITGALGWNAQSGLFSWTPNQESVTIGGVTYGLTENGTGCPSNSGCINISTPTGMSPSVTSVRDDITTTPEPATVAFMATGLVGLVPIARRRRKI